jgi:hypothetical protein
MLKKFCVLWLAISIPFTLVSQQVNCDVTLPVTVLLPDGTLVRKLNSDQFVVTSGKSEIPIESLTIDNGPRRIVFVVETGKRVVEAARKIEAGVLETVLSQTPSVDSLALITAYGPLKEVRFGENRDRLKAAISEIGNSPRGASQPTGILDALQTATDWLKPHQPGDAVLVLTMGIEGSSSRISFKKIADSLTSSDIRLYGFQLGTPIMGSATLTLAPAPTGNELVPRVVVSPNEESLNALSTRTGGFMFVEVTNNESRTYKISEQRLSLLEKGGIQMYKAIKEYYVLRVSSRVKVDLDVADSVRAKLPQAMVSYPRRRDYCSTAGNL